MKATKVVKKIYLYGKQRAACTPSAVFSTAPFSFFMILALCASLTLTGCSSGTSGKNGVDNQTETETDSSSKEARPEDISYVFYCRSPKNQETVLLYPGMEPSAALKQLGEPLSYYEAPSCALAGMDQIYTYSGFELTVSVEESASDTGILTSIRLTDDSFTTAEGIYIGSGVTELLAAYDDTDVTPESGEYCFPKGEMELAFLTKNQVVISVEYRYQPSE